MRRPADLVNEVSNMLPTPYHTDGNDEKRFLILAFRK